MKVLHDSQGLAIRLTDAVVALLNGLSEKHLVQIVETFHKRWGHDERLRATLKHFREWNRRRD
ncbi:MAG: hypothetical protein HYY13_10710 [Nitrospirae bacterium]|nr:hypothetical protein [Nitrospirota bacterium]